jgi:DNA-binding transcriptional LysR family regulator
MTVPARPRRWLGVEYRHLATFAAVARERSFRGAARAMGYSQPSVSQNISDLEQLLGVAIIVRPAGGAVGLTAAGATLLALVEPVLEQFAAARADLASHAGPVRVGISTMLAPTVVPSVLRAVAVGHPAATVAISESAADAELAARVAGGTLDLAIGAGPARRGPFALRRLGRSPYVVVIPAAWTTVSDDGVSAGELAGLPAIACAAAGDVDGELRARGLQREIVGHATSVRAALAQVISGLGAAILPEPAVPASDPRLRTVPLGELVAPRAICAYWHRDRVARPELADVIAAAEACVSVPVAVARVAPLRPRPVTRRPVRLRGHARDVA